MNKLNQKDNPYEEVTDSVNTEDPFKMNDSSISKENGEANTNSKSFPENSDKLTKAEKGKIKDNKNKDSHSINNDVELGSIDDKFDIEKEKVELMVNHEFNEMKMTDMCLKSVYIDENDTALMQEQFQKEENRINTDHINDEKKIPLLIYLYSQVGSK